MALIQQHPQKSAGTSTCQLLRGRQAMQRTSQLKQRSSCQTKSDGMWTSHQQTPHLQALMEVARILHQHLQSIGMCSWIAPEQMTAAMLRSQQQLTGTSQWTLPVWNRRPAAGMQEVMRQQQALAMSGMAHAMPPTRCWQRSWTAATHGPGPFDWFP